MSVECRKHPTLPVLCYSDGSVELIKESNMGPASSRLYTPCGLSHKYFTVRIYENGKRKHKKVHRLIAEAFLPNPYNLPMVDHINRDTHDNRLENLRWASAQMNGRNTIRQQHEPKDRSHNEASSRYYFKMKDNGYVKKNNRWIKKEENKC